MSGFKVVPKLSKNRLRGSGVFQRLAHVGTLGLSDLFPGCQCQARRAASAELQEKLMEPPAAQGMGRQECLQAFCLLGASSFCYGLVLCGDGTCASAGMGGGMSQKVDAFALTCAINPDSMKATLNHC